MQAILVRKVGSFEVVEVDRPKPGPGEVLVRVAVTGLWKTATIIVVKLVRAMLKTRNYTKGDKTSGDNKPKNARTSRKN